MKQSRLNVFSAVELTSSEFLSNKRLEKWTFNSNYFSLMGFFKLKLTAAEFLLSLKEKVKHLTLSCLINGPQEVI